MTPSSKRSEPSEPSEPSDLLGLQEPAPCVEPEDPLPPGGSGAMFDGIAHRYDLLNRLMSLGFDKLWRNRLVKILALKGPAHVLDVATGTADVALGLCRHYPEVKVTGLDPSLGMLQQAQRKIDASRYGRRIGLMQGDAQALPFKAPVFDAACISFGIRNIPNRLQALNQMVRVCKPGSPVAVLELAETSENPGGWGPWVRWYLHQVVPRLGAWLSGARAYRYLQTSMAAFPAAPVFVAMMEQAGLTHVRFRRMGWGVVYLYEGTVPDGRAWEEKGGFLKEGPCTSRTG